MALVHQSNGGRLANKVALITGAASGLRRGDTVLSVAGRLTSSSILNALAANPKAG